MHKFLYIFTVFLYIFGAAFCSDQSIVLQASTEPLFYKITQDETALLKISENKSVSNDVICLLPKTYFVKPIQILDENFLEASYLGITGAVKLSALTPVYSAPITPYSIQTFDLIHTANATVWEYATTESRYLTSIPYHTTEILYIGSTTGQKLNSLDLGIWYLCKYADSENGTTIGYIHSSLVINLTEFEANTETVQLEPDIQASANILAPELGNTNNLLIILLLTIPAIIILLIIIKPKRSNKQAAKRQIKNLNQLSLPDKNNNNDLDF